MKSAPRPKNESGRQNTLNQYRILDTSPEKAFDDITLLASLICETPISTISLVDRDRQWFKSGHGGSFAKSIHETPREVAFCAHAILGREPMIVSSPETDERFRDNPMVIGDPKIRFYAGAPLISPDGHAVGTLCVIDQVPRVLTTSQIKALEALAAQVISNLELRRSNLDLENQRALLKNVISTIPYYVFWKDRSSVYEGCNELFAHAAGLKSPDEIVGKTDFDLPWKHEETVSYQQYDQKVMRSGVPDLNFEENQLRADGSERIVLTSKVPLRDLDGTVTGILGVYTDITEFKQAQSKITEQQAKLVANSKMSALGEMAGGIAHEINNPLSVIYGRASQLKDKAIAGKITSETVVSYAQKIETTAIRISKIVKSLRSFARDADNDPFEPVSVRTLFEDTGELCTQRLRNHQIDLIIDPVPAEMVIHCRSVQISQVLLNLLNNSHDAVENLPEKWIHLNAVETEHLIEISVTDSGPGIAKELQDRILEPFFTTKEIGKGTGLGLSLSKGIIESHRGQLRLDTSSPNTRFIVSLPKAIPK